jgi:flagellar basal-body rod protein FlgG
MIRALWTAATGMETQQTNMDVIANNLANVNSVGFKKSRADFQDILYQTVKIAGASSAPGVEIPTGDIQQSGNDLDLAIEGSGFFQVAMPTGETAYTRAGAFKKDSTGRMVTSDGYPLSPEIVIPENATQISIGQYGTVEVFLDGESAPTEVGTIELTRFSNPAGLSAMGHNLYSETPTTGAPSIGTPGENGFGSLAQGFLEGSNVNIMEEMVNMIAGQRAYEINSKAIKTADDMLQMTNNLM